MPSTRWPLVLSALLGVTGVIAGALGAHAVAGILGLGQISTWQTAAYYHVIHAVALLALAIPLSLGHGSRGMTFSVIAFGAGTVLFSGSIYTLLLTGFSALGPITPLGGLLLMVGWLNLVRVAWLGYSRT